MRKTPEFNPETRLLKKLWASLQAEGGLKQPMVRDCLLKFKHQCQEFKLRGVVLVHLYLSWHITAENSLTLMEISWSETHLVLNSSGIPIVPRRWPGLGLPSLHNKWRNQDQETDQRPESGRKGVRIQQDYSMKVSPWDLKLGVVALRHSQDNSGRLTTCGNPSFAGP